MNKKLILSLGMIVLTMVALASCKQVKHEHTYGDSFSYNETQHWKECLKDGCDDVSEKENHHGGTATCTELAICEDCGVSYASKAEHNFTESIATEKYLVSVADCDSAATYYKSCVCGEKGTETFTTGEALNHDLEMKHDANQHWEECKREGCDHSTTKENHKGGIATQTELAKCSVCGTAYGELANHEHSFTKQIEEATYLASAATCTADATYYYGCTEDGCTSVGTTTWTKVGSALGHDMGDWSTVGLDGYKTQYCEREGCDHSVSEFALGTSEDPITVDAAIGAMADYASGDKSTALAYVSGVVVKLEENYSGVGYYKVTIAVSATSEEKLVIFQPTYEGKLCVGDEVIVKGNLELYVNSSDVATFEVTSGSFEEITHTNTFTISASVVDEEGNASTNATVSTIPTSSKCCETISFTATPATGYVVEVYVNDKEISAKEGTYNVVVNKNLDIKVVAKKDAPLASPYSYEFTEKKIDNVGSFKLGDVNWKVNATWGTGESYFGFDTNNGKGQQIGSGSKPATTLSLSTSEIPGEVGVIKVKTSGASNIAGTLVVTVGGTQVGDAITLTNTATEYTFNANGLSGEVVFTWTQTSSKAIYINSIYVEFEANTCEHSYVETVLEENANIASAADCENAAKYYKVCEHCDEYSEETFSHGTALGHDYTGAEYVGDENGHWQVCVRENCENKSTVSNHEGGEATCTTAKVCTVCDTSYGEALGHDDAKDLEWKTDSEGHWKECHCGEVVVAKVTHSGGTATETEQAKCEHCNTSYGELAGHVHSFTVQDDSESYLASAATCTADATYYYACTGASCVEKDPTNTWTKEGTALGHGYTGAEYVGDENGHWQVCTRENCENKSEVASHGGGTATCVAKAVCTVCSTSYGELGDHTYSEWTSIQLDGTRSRTCEHDSTHVEKEENLFGTEETPLTVAEIRAAMSGFSSGNSSTVSGYVKGYVVSSTYYPSYGTWTIDLVDDLTATDSAIFELYGCANPAAVGDFVVSTGTLKLYNSTYEFNKGCTIVSATHNGTSTITSSVVDGEGNASENATISGLPSEAVTCCSKVTFTVTPNDGYDIVVKVDGTTVSAVDGEFSFYAYKDIAVEVVVTKIDTSVLTVTYKFSKYTAGTQYATETHKLDDILTMNIENCHLTSQLRIYSSSTYNGIAIFSSTKVIKSIAFNMGYKKDTLNVYGSTDGSNWTLVGNVTTTSTSYLDYDAISISTDTSSYKYIKLDVDGTQQIRIASMTVSYINDEANTCEHSYVETVLEEDANIASAADCENAAKYYKVCEHCGEYSEETFSHGTALGHDYTGAEYVGDENGHWQVCVRENCENKSEVSNHEGGEATCTAAKVCTVCNTSYGETLEHNIVQYEEVAATCDSVGYAAYQACSVCGGESTYDKSSETMLVFLVPNSNWKEASARFAIYYWNDDGDEWTSMTKVDENLYSAEINVEAASTGVIFCRMNPSYSDNIWDNRWNQTGNLTLSVENNTYTIPADAWTGSDNTNWSNSSHSIVSYEAKAPTCTEVGYEAYEECKHCGYSTYKEIKATGHVELSTAYVVEEDKLYLVTSCSCGHIESKEEVTEAEVSVSNESDLRAVISAGRNVVISEDMKLAAAIEVTKDVTINLNGKTLSIPEDTEGNGVFYVTSGTLTLNGEGTVNGVGNNIWNIAIWADGGKVVINGGTYTNVGATDTTTDDSHFDLIYVKNGGEVEINGGTFIAETPVWTLNSHDSLKGTFVVKGGTFYNYDPSNNETENPVVSWVADGYHAAQVGENYEVVACEQANVKYVAEEDKLYEVNVCSCGYEVSKEEVDTTVAVSVSNEADLKTVLYAGYNVVLANDIDLTSSIELDGEISVEINLNGKTLAFHKETVEEGDIIEVFWVKNGAKLTIDGEGTVSATVAENQTVETYYVEALSATDSAEVTIKNGYFYSNGCTSIYATRGAVVNIYGGKYEATTEYDGVLFTLDINEAAEVVGVINVYGGTFVEFDPSNVTTDGSYTNKVADGYCSVLDGENYVVAEHLEYVSKEGYAASCTSTGLTNQVSCSRCEEVLQKQEAIDALGHTYENDAVYHWYTCTCGEVTPNVKVVHTWVVGEASGTSRTDTCECGLTREVDIWDGEAISTSLEGEGTEVSPYLISSAADLAYFANSVTAGTTYEGLYVKMTKSIDLNNNSLMIGTSTNVFAGTFDGGNNAVINANIEGTKYVGLFANTATTSMVKNLSVYGSISGTHYVGGIVGYLAGSVDNCYNYATVTGTTERTGGIVGESKTSIGTISNCINFGAITGKTYTGGIVGTSGAITISNCKNEGTVTGASGNYTGGIVGCIVSNVTTTVTNCSNEGTVYNKTYNNIGGIIGGAIGDASISNITNCHNNGTVSGNAKVGSIMGSYRKGTVKDSNNYGEVYVLSTTTEYGAIVGYDYSEALELDNCVNYGKLYSNGTLVE